MLSKTQCIFIIEHYLCLHYNEDERYIYFQQDGARAHMSEQTIKFLHKFFSNRLVSIGLWTPWSTDLTPFNFFDFCHSSRHHRRAEATYYHGNSEHYSENIAKGFPKYDAPRCCVKISMECIFSICLSLILDNTDLIYKFHDLDK